ncbi:hypothetical protein P879_05593 [Paragonimus westermani]|uniref:U6 small nuclear RNA (adenine-(43)-N(6))-methyltransferase n=1 Tax=Paragonimus westermani TaxID=34504 RepID=A0A8T0D429_9TREM|nr:hypothetical protein P879_05593 [Paragonimus westermani]
MALNKYMHPRNIYRSHKPQFKQLAQKYPFFKDVIQEDEEGRISLDFKVPSHLAALSKALLLNDFGLDLEFPLDRLVPTVPLRLNYILWLEDIIQSFHPPGTPVTVLDVGVGASCIYPLLGAKKNGWRFVGTEIDARNYAVAVESVARNSLQHLVQILQIKEGDSSMDAVFNSDLPPAPVPSLTAVMANPPFYCDASDVIGSVTSRSITRPSAKTVSSAARHESQTFGGEVFFCMRLARDSVKYATRVGVFTVMLGKKSSVVPFKRILRKLKIPKVSVYELCQGRIMRWGVAWTFQPNVKFPESEFRRLRKFEKPPLTLVLPSHLSCLPSYTVEALLDWLRAEFKQLKMKCIDQKNRAEIGGVHLSICATENTWTHSRRKRREAERLARSQLSNTSVNSDTHLTEPGAESESKQNDGSQLSYVDPPSTNLKRPHMENPAELNGCISSKTSLADVDTSTETKRPRIQEICDEGEAWVDDFLPPMLYVGAYCSDVSVSPIIRADIFVEQRAHDELEPAVDQPELDDDDAMLRNLEPTGPLVIKIEFVEGSCREAANQILCYLKNRLR